MASFDEINPQSTIDGIIKLNKELQNTNTTVAALLAENEKLKKQFEEIGASTKSVAEKSTAYQKILSDTEKEQVKINASAKEMQRQETALAATEVKLAQVNSETNKKLIEKQVALQAANKAQKDALKINEAEEGSLNRMRQRLAELTKAYDNSAIRTKEAAKEILTLSNNISAAEQSTGRYGRSVGDYKTGILGLGKAFITGQIGIPGLIAGIKAIGVSIASIPIIGWIAAAVAGFALLGKSLVENSREFEKAVSSLSAITGAQGDDLDYMRKKAIEYSKTSVSSAVEIVKAFEKVGSALPELLKQKELLTEVTANAIALSEASGGQLSVADAAIAAASAMKQFNIPLTESKLAVNALAAGSLAGKAEIDSLVESFKTGGPVMQNANLSLYESVAALEQLAEKGIMGSEAGTAMKSVLLNLKKEGKGFVSGQFEMRDALIQVNEEMKAIKDPIAKAAYEEKVFGAYGITAGTIMRTNIPLFDSLTNAVTGTNTAFEQQQIQTDNLDSSYKKFGNAWQSLMLSIEDGTGWMAKTWKWIVDDVAKSLNNLSDLFNMFKSKEAKDRSKERKEQRDTEAAKRAELLATAELLGITVDKKAKLADIQLAIDTKLAENKAEMEKTAAAEASKAAEAAKAAAEERRQQQEKGFKLAADIAEKGAELNKKALENQKKDQEEFSKWENDLLNDSFEKDKAIAEASVEFMLGESDREYRRKVMLINATTKDKEEAAQKIYELDVQSAQASIDTMNNAMNSINASEEEKWQYKEKIAAAQMDLDEMVADHEVDTAEKAAEKKKKLQESIYEASMSVANSLFDFMDSKYAGELTALEQKNEAGLLSEKEYATQKAEIEIKQAKATRARGIFDATINTATAIIKALADPGGIAGVILSVAAGVTGVLQIASILSTPLPVMPAFEHGTLNAPETFRAAERNKRELGYLNNGEVVMFEKDGIYSDPKFKGARIVPNAMTEAIMNQTKAPTYNHSSMSDTRIVNELKAVRKSIDNAQKPIYDSRGEIIGTYNRNHREINRSKRYTPWG